MLRRIRNPERVGVKLTPTDSKELTTRGGWHVRGFRDGDDNVYERAQKGNFIRWYLLDTEAPGIEKRRLAVKVKANESLLERWRELGSRIGGLASIVQNDTEVTSEQILEWLGHVDFSIAALMALRDTTVCYCFSMNTEGRHGNLEIEKPIEVISGGRSMLRVVDPTVHPRDIQEVQTGDVIAMFCVVKAMVVRPGAYRIYRCSYDEAISVAGSSELPQGSCILNEQAVCEALFPALAAVARPDPY